MKREATLAQEGAHESETPASPSQAPFPYRDYVQARGAILAAAHDGPFYGLVTGPSGTGKSSLARDLARTLERPRFQIVYVSSSRAPRSECSSRATIASSNRIAPRRPSSKSAQTRTEAAW